MTCTQYELMMGDTDGLELEKDKEDRTTTPDMAQ